MWTFFCQCAYVLIMQDKKGNMPSASSIPTQMHVTSHRISCTLPLSLSFNELKMTETEKKNMHWIILTYICMSSRIYPTSIPCLWTLSLSLSLYKNRKNKIYGRVGKASCTIIHDSISNNNLEYADKAYVHSSHKSIYRNLCDRR